MTGISWGGFNALQVAARHPPALKAVIALCCSDDRYADDVHYYGGNLLTEDAMWSSFILGLGALPPDPQIVGDRWRSMWNERLEAAACWSSVWMRHQRRDAYWKRGSVCEDFSAIDIPVYAISGWDDTYYNAVPRLMAGLSGPRKGLIGPWSHAYPFLGEPGPAIHYLKEAIRWWRHWLGGIDDGLMEEPAYTTYLKNPHRPAHHYPDHPGRWVRDPSWPSPNVRQEVLFLNAATLGAAPAAGQPMRLRSPVTAGRDCGRYGGYGGTVPDMAGDQRREDGLGLCFDTAPLAEDLDLLGAPAIDVTLRSDMTFGTLTARLCEVLEDGVSVLITWGALNLRHRDAHENPAPLPTNEPVGVRLELNHCGRRIGRGNRLRLVLSNQHWPVLWPQPGMPTFTFEPGAGRLTLPVRSPQADDGELLFDEAEISPPIAMEAIEDEAHSRLLAIEAATRTETLTLTSNHGRQYLMDRANETWSRVVDRMAIVEDDPLSARVETGWVLGYRSKEANAEVTSRVEVTSTDARFRLNWRLEVRDDGDLVFEREGGEWIDRDHI